MSMDLQSLLPMLMSMMGGNPSQGGDMLSQGLTTASGFFIDPQSGMGQALAPLISEEISPFLRDKLGMGPLDMVGGVNSVWNPVSHMNRFTDQNMQRNIQRQTRQLINRQNEEMFQASMRRRGLDPSTAGPLDINRLAIKAGTAMSGASSINRALGSSMSAMGYTFGMPSDAEARSNDQLFQNLFGEKGLGTQITQEYVQNQQAYGNLGGAGMADLMKGMTSRGMMSLEGADQGKIDRLKNEIRDSAKAISGIRDIIKGPVAEVIRQLESTFGAESVSLYGAGGFQRAASKMGELRQLADMSGLTTGQLAQYSRASGMISQQLAGHSIGTMEAGGIIGSFIAARNAPGSEWALKGLDQNAFAEVMTKRVTGAQLSTTALMTNYALARASDAGLDEEKMKELRTQIKKAAAAGPVNEQELSRLLKDAGVEASSTEILEGRNTRTARDWADTDDTGTWTALANTKRNVEEQKRDVLMGLGYDPANSTMSLREFEKHIRENGTKEQKEKLGHVASIFNMIATDAGYDNDEQIYAMSSRMETAQQKKEVAVARQAVAEKFATASSGVSGFLKDIGTGANIQDSLKSLAGMMKDEDKQKFFMESYGRDKIESLEKFLKGSGEGTTELETKAREQVFQDVMTTMITGFDKDGKRIDQATFDVNKEMEDQLKIVQESGDYLLDEAAADATFNKKTKKSDKLKFSSLTFEKKQEALARTLEKKLYGKAGDTKVTEEYLDKLRTAALEKDKVDDDFLTGNLQSTTEEGIKKGLPDFVEEVKALLVQIRDLLPIKTG